MPNSANRMLCLPPPWGGWVGCGAREPWRCWLDGMANTYSSAIRAVDYDHGSQQMQIWFTSGGPYTFYRVPYSVYADFMSASSMGQYYNQYIRGRYR